MFGYVTVKKEELKIKDFQKYQAYYCGLCQELKERSGILSQLTLTYDMTFLTLLLSGLYESPTTDEKHFCPMHPVKRHWCLKNDVSAYAADMNVLLCYYNLLDDWRDEGRRSSYLAAKALRGQSRRLMEAYPRQARAVKRYLGRLHECEKQNLQSIDLAAGYTGEFLGEIFVWKQDCWTDTLRCMGFYLGKFIYLMDAYEDAEKDKKSGCYNPLVPLMAERDFEEKAAKILTMMAAECCRAFERLPIVDNVEILRNILYAGIWEKYDRLKKDKEKN